MKFYKYQGAGNDFIIIDNRNRQFISNVNVINNLCDRHFGIGADGLILLEDDVENDFYMRYFNADGNESTMCGNGGRCIVAFAHKLGIAKSHFCFNSIDGLHTAKIIEVEDKSYIIKLKMTDVLSIQENDDCYFLNTGSPHHICFIDDLDNFNVVSEGKLIRNSKIYAPDGTNVNFVELLPNNELFVRTYERGVEDETLACGTGVTAAALATAVFTESDQKMFIIRTLGGTLKVSFDNDDNGYFYNIYLEGPTALVFEGTIDI